MGPDVTRPGGLAWFGATMVWIFAATLSFAGLDGLAAACYISPTLAPLLPAVIDLGVAVAAWVWRRGVNPEASRLAGRLTWSLLVLTIVGNGAHLGMESAHITPPWWVAAIVGAIPAAVAGTVAHLLVLLGRSVDATGGINESMLLPDTPGPSPVEAVPAPTSQLASNRVGPKQKPSSLAPGSDKTSAETLARALVAENPTIGRRALMVETGLSDYHARKLLEQARAEAPRNGHAVLQEATK